MPCCWWLPWCFVWGCMEYLTDSSPCSGQLNYLFFFHCGTVLLASLLCFHTYKYNTHISMLFLIMCCCGNILQHGTVGRVACAISGLAQITVALNYCIPLSISYIYHFVWISCMCQEHENYPPLLQFAFTSKPHRLIKHLEWLSSRKL